MCRLLGVLGKKSVDATWLRQFRNLAVHGKSKDGAGHQDGWGIVAYQEGMPTYLGREPVTAATDARYEIAVDAVSSGAIRTLCLVAHVRRASPGIEVNLKNTHPFNYKNWTFCHNGTIIDFSPALQIPLDGTTDSETLFKYLLPGLLANLEKPYEFRIRDSIGDAKKIMKKYRALNFILSNGESLFAYRDFNESEVSPEMITLKYCKTDDAVAVCSEPLTVHVPEKEWDDLKNRQMLIVDKELDVKLLNL
jgi:glutamine amidotransferase